MDIKENTGVMFNNKQWTEGSKQPRVRGEINVGGKTYGNCYVGKEVSKRQYLLLTCIKRTATGKEIRGSNTRNKADKLLS